ncbi:DUF2339 domain-containing protein [Actinomycetota bacterium]
MTSQQTVQALETELATAMEHLYSVGNGLARLRQELAMESPAQPAAVPPPPTAVRVPPDPQLARPSRPTSAPMPAPVRTAVPAPVAVPGPAPAAVPPAAAAGQPQQARPAQGSGTLLVRAIGVIGAGITLIGVAMLLAIAIRNGLFGPIPRVVSGAALAIALVAAAHVLRARTGNHAGAVAVAATGYAAAYLDIVGATAIYGWLPDAAGLALAGLVAATGLVVARRWDSELLAVITVLGSAALAPTLSGLGWLTPAFLTVLAIGSLPAQLGRDWLALQASRILPATAAVTAGITVDPLGRYHVMAAALLVTTIVGSVLADRDPRLVTTGRAAAGAVSALLVAASALPILTAAVRDDRTAGVATGLMTGLALLALALVGARVAFLPDAVRATLVALSAPALAIAGLRLTESDSYATVILALALGYAAAGLWLRLRTPSAVGAVVALCASPWLMWLMTMVASRDQARSTLTLHTAIDALLALLLVLALATSAHRVWRVRDDLPVALLSVLTGLAAATGLIVSLGVATGRVVAGPDPGFVAGHALATILWLVAAAALLRHGLTRGARVWQTLGPVLAFAAVGKLILFDLSALEGMWRVLAFIGGGVLLLAIGVGYAKALDDQGSQPRPAQPAAAMPPAGQTSAPQTNAPRPHPGTPAVDNHGGDLPNPPSVAGDRPTGPSTS